MTKKRKLTPNGWKPRLDIFGNIISGYGYISYQGRVVINPGWTPFWSVPGERIICGVTGDQVIEINLDGSGRVEHGQAFNNVYAAGAHRVYLAKPTEYWVDIDPLTGRLAKITEAGGNNTRSLYVEDELIVRDEPISECRMAGNLLVWSHWTGGHIRRTIGRDQIGAIHDLTVVHDTWEGAPVPINAPNEPWVLVATNTDLRLHPWKSAEGYIIATGEDQNLHPDAIWLQAENCIRVTWNTKHGELRTQDIRLSEPRVNVGRHQEPPPPPPPPPEDKVFKNYEADLLRIWNELGIPEKMAEVTRRNSVSFEETQQLRRLSAARKSGVRMAASPRMADLEQAYLAVQVPAIVHFAGHMFHQRGNRDVGLSTKNGGNHWTLTDGRKVAVDIITVKPTTNDKVVAGNFVLVDVLVSSGSADTRPGWSVLGENTDSSRPWAEPPLPAGTDPVDPPPAGDTHRYVGGGNDTGECDLCHKPKLDAVHRVAEGKTKHKPWLGEDNKGDCDLCFQPIEAAIHQSAPEPEPEPEPEPVPEVYHPFVGSATAKFCGECGQARTAQIHQKPVEPPPAGDFDDTRIVSAIMLADQHNVAAIEALRADVNKAAAEIKTAIKGIKLFAPAPKRTTKKR